MAFSLSLYPWVYIARFDQSWTGTALAKELLDPEKEALMSDQERTELANRRNSFPELPLINYTTQYGMGCFEGLKAFPQRTGGLKIFRPNENAARMKRSMEGLLMPGIDEDLFLKGVLEVIGKNKAAGYAPSYDPEWEKDFYQSGGAVYIRPFSYTEPGIGVNLSKNPWVLIAATPVSAYFKGGTNSAVITKMVRATPYGTGWIKCASNYVIPALAKKKAEKKGFMEVIFLDSTTGKNIEEGSSCNFFSLMKDGTLVTPALGDTILPGITRASIIQLAKDRGISVEERALPLTEVLSNSRECFVTGTAAGITYLSSLTHEDKEQVFNNGAMGELTRDLLKELKGIQYGAVPDRHHWMVEA